MKLKKRMSGFTLIEIIVSVTIIAVLLTVGVTSYRSVSRKSRDSKRRADLEQIRSALEMFRSDNGYYPDAGAGSYTRISGNTPDVNFTADIVTSGYMPVMPQDPGSTQYHYWYQALNVVAGQYYGYCLNAALEAPPSGATPCASGPAPLNYTVRNP